MAATLTERESCNQLPGKRLNDPESGIFVGTIYRGVLYLPLHKHGRVTLVRLSTEWLCGELATSVGT